MLISLLGRRIFLTLFDLFTSYNYQSLFSVRLGREKFKIRVLSREFVAPVILIIESLTSMEKNSTDAGALRHTRTVDRSSKKFVLLLLAGKELKQEPLEW